MRLYHGSNVDIKEINLAMCRPYKDFGQGFYLTVLREQAEKMAKRVATIYGGDAIVNQYDLDEKALLNDKDLKILNFGLKTSEAWARFVRNNRNRKLVDIYDTENNLDKKYDIVIGPVANDAMTVLFRQYENGMIDFDTMLKGMEYKETTNQYSFHTEKAISLLKKVEK